MKNNILSVRTETEVVMGEKFVVFLTKVLFEGKSYELSITFGMLQKYIRQHLPEVAAYLFAVRKNIIGYGTKEPEVIAKTIDEEFDWLQIMQTFYTSENGMMQIEHHIKLYGNAANNDLGKSQEVYSELKKLAKQPCVTHSEICDVIEKAINDALIDKYDIASKADSHHFEQLQNAYVNNVMNLASDLEPILNDILFGNQTEKD